MSAGAAREGKGCGCSDQQAQTDRRGERKQQQQQQQQQQQSLARGDTPFSPVPGFSCDAGQYPHFVGGQFKLSQISKRLFATTHTQLPAL